MAVYTSNSTQVCFFLTLPLYPHILPYALGISAPHYAARSVSSAAAAPDVMLAGFFVLDHPIGLFPPKSATLRNLFVLSQQYTSVYTRSASAPGLERRSFTIHNLNTTYTSREGCLQVFREAAASSAHTQPFTLFCFHAVGPSNINCAPPRLCSEVKACISISFLILLSLVFYLSLPTQNLHPDSHPHTYFPPSMASSTHPLQVSCSSF